MRSRERSASQFPTRNPINSEVAWHPPWCRLRFVAMTGSSLFFCPMFVKSQLDVLNICLMTNTSVFLLITMHLKQTGNCQTFLQDNIHLCRNRNIIIVPNRAIMLRKNKRGHICLSGRLLLFFCEPYCPSLPIAFHLLYLLLFVILAVLNRWFIKSYKVFQ